MTEPRYQHCANIIWKIENFTYCWQDKGEILKSGRFFVQCLDDSSWELMLYPKGDKESDGIGLYLKRSDNNKINENVRVKFSIEVLKNGNVSFVKRVSDENRIFLAQGWGWDNFVSRSDIVNKADMLYPKNVLTIRCKMWCLKAPQSCCSTVVNLQTLIQVTQCLFEWNINLADMSHQDKTITFPSLFGSKENLQVKLTYVCQDVDGKVLKIFISGDASAGYSYRCDFQTVQGNDNFFLTAKKIGMVLPYRFICSTLLSEKELVANSEKYLTENILALNCELSIISHKPRNTSTQAACSVESEKSSTWCPRMGGNYFLPVKRTNTEKRDNCCLLKSDVLKMYRESLNSDLSVQVESQVFPVHSSILSARSAVLQRMLATEMKEKQEKIWKIEDFDGNTVKKMLDYLYTDNPGELNIESAIRLYYAGDKYELSGLKKLCSEYLMQNLAICNVYEVLISAYQLNDEELKTSAIQYIIENEKEIVLGDEFKTFSKNNPQLGVEVMQGLLEHQVEKFAHL